jgi:hypothetical protein
VKQTLFFDAADSGSNPIGSSQVMDHPLADYMLNNHHSNSMADMSPDEPIKSQTLDSNKIKQRGACLTLSDHDRLRIFIHEFIVRGLIPWAEKTLRTLNEQVRVV